MASGLLGLVGSVASLVCVTALGGCGLVLGLGDFEDQEPSGASSQEGASGPGGSGGSSGSGANGGQGTGGFVEECPGTSVCVPAPPNGWTGPAMLYVGTEPPSACGSGWAEGITGHSGALTGGHTCSMCKCDPPAGAQCSVPEVYVYGTSNCTGSYSTYFPTATGSCVNTNGGYGAKAEASLPTGGSCAATGGEPLKDEASWDSAALVCSGSTIASCPGGTCAATPGAPFGAELCVYRDGEEPGCPLDYPTRTVVYRGINDTRACSDCDCGSPSGITCPVVLTAWSTSDCTGGMTLSSPLPGDGACHAEEYYSGVQYANAPAGGSCPELGGAPSGGVAPALPMTVCCASR